MGAAEEEAAAEAGDSAVVAMVAAAGSASEVAAVMMFLILVLVAAVVEVEVEATALAMAQSAMMADCVPGASLPKRPPVAHLAGDGLTEGARGQHAAQPGSSHKCEVSRKSWPGRQESSTQQDRTADVPSSPVLGCNSRAGPFHPEVQERALHWLTRAHAEDPYWIWSERSSEGEMAYACLDARVASSTAQQVAARGGRALRA